MSTEVATGISKGFYSACDDIKAYRRYVVYAGQEKFAMKDKVTAIPLSGLMKELASRT